MSSPLAEAFLMDSLNSCYETPSYTLLEELQSEFRDVELSEEYLNTNEGVIFKLVISGRIAEYFDEYGL